MNLTPLTVIIAGSGGILIYCAVKGYDPRDVVKGALSGDWPPTAKYVVGASTGTVTPGPAAPVPTTPNTPQGDGHDDGPNATYTRVDV